MEDEAALGGGTCNATLMNHNRPLEQLGDVCILCFCAAYLSKNIYDYLQKKTHTYIARYYGVTNSNKKFCEELKLSLSVPSLSDGVRRCT